jgi:hypothetical protein
MEFKRAANNGHTHDFHGEDLVTLMYKHEHLETGMDMTLSVV